jgi:predicted Holliday junction resolvase-like endonuclease
LSGDLASAFLAGLLVGLAGALILLWRRDHAIRRDAVARSRAVIRGQAVEHLAPLLPEFDFHPGDARFLGHPIDYVVFDGLSEDREQLEIVFVEIKTGEAHLSRREAAVREAVRAGRVTFRTVRF